MLPKILDVAEENGVTIKLNTYGKRQVLCKCPFCQEDSKPGKEKRFYLSLNTNEQIFRCWYCGESGGVIQFEAKLTGLPYNQVKEKRLGKLRKPLHPAERLNPKQLDAIGWKDKKRKDRKAFAQRREDVFLDWKEYEYTELVGLFAEFMLIAFLNTPKVRQEELMRYLMDRAKGTQIHLGFSKLLKEYVKDEEFRSEWAKEGTKLARMAWKACYQTDDFELEKIVLYVPFFHYQWKLERTERKQKQLTQNKMVVTQ
ncbi:MULTISPECIES: CHC2 zinc finger domain-containing protein [Bacillaceae]|uniref:CHC2 zinc finger domain-containing protein n=1 Tax=Bacillaceae TaxID=186817 RepID=UPI0005A79F8D|nr:CHC2 zinc finger domain-containing protein [Bacillus rubiinfantis]